MKAQIISCAIVAIGTLLCLVGFSYSFVPSVTCRSPWLRIQMRDGSRSFKGGRGAGSGDVAFGRKDSRGAPTGGKKPRLDQREGARQLTRAELKAKEIYDAMKVPQVQRMYAPQERVPLKDVQVGQKLRGRIIAVKEFGLFVDCGTLRDGLVHVKDISKDYFIQNHEQKFLPGQDIDVWVKFVDDDAQKLGLQMFPVVSSSSSQNRDLVTVDLNELQEEDEVTGTVVRVSNFGVFVDIGAGVDAFLHRRKMKLSKKMLSLKPWEVAPLGSKVVGFVHEVDRGRRRISITTYAPEQWDMLPMKAERDDQGMVEDEEELGGSAMAENFRALERTLALTTDDDEDDDDDEGEELSAEEIKALTATRASRPQILIDDFDGEGGDDDADPDDVMAEGRASGAAFNEASEEISVEELFQELCGRGKDYVTVKDIKKWDYLQELVRDGEVTDESLVELFEDAGAVQGKLTEDQFDQFIDLLADSLGLEEEGGSLDGSFDEDDVDEAEEEDGDSDGLLVIDDFGGDAAPTSPAATSKPPVAVAKSAADKRVPAAAEQDNDEDDDELDFGLGFAGAAPLGSGPLEGISTKSTSSAGAGAGASSGANDISLEEHYNRKSSTNDLFRYVFNSVAGKKGHVLLEDVMQWDFVTALVSQGAASADEIKGMFNKCGPRNGRLSVEQFDKLVTMLSDIDPVKPKALDTAEGRKAESKGAAKADNKAVKMSKNDDDDGEQGEFDDEGDDDDDEYGDMDISVEAMFKELSGGRDEVTLEAVASCEMVEGMIENGDITREDFEELFMQAGGKKVAAPAKGKAKGKAAAARGSAVLDLEGFEQLLDLLAPLVKFDEEYMDDDEDDAGEVSERHDMRDQSVSEDDDDDNIGDDDEEDEDEDELLSNVFEGLANGKRYVTLKDLRNWDIVLELMGDGLLTEDALKELMAQCEGFNGNGVPMEGFDQLVDKLVDLYGEMDEFDGDGDGVAAASDDDEDAEVAGSDGAQDEDEDDDDDYIDIDTEVVFEEVAKGKDYITFQDLTEWELIKGLREAGQMDDAELKEILAAAGVKNENKMDIVAFEAVLDELSAGLDDEDDEE